MLFTALQQYDSAQIQAELIGYLGELGLDESILNTTLRGDITIGSLTNGLTERLIAKAAEEDRRRFREKPVEAVAQVLPAATPRISDSTAIIMPVAFPPLLAVCQTAKIIQVKIRSLHMAIMSLFLTYFFSLAESEAVWSL